jgi:hypothetical protein
VPGGTSIPTGGVRAIPTNVGLKAMLELLPQQKENIEDRGTEGAEEEKPKCSQHPEKVCTVLCMSCKEGLCSRCMKSVGQGAHAGHDLEDFDDGIQNIKEKIKKEVEKVNKIEESCSKVCDTANRNLAAWKSSLEKDVDNRASAVVDKVDKWKSDMMKKIQDFFKQGSDQIKRIKHRFNDIREANPNANKVRKLDTLPMLSSYKKLNSLKQSVDGLESELKVYQSARLVPQEALSDQWTVELGEIKSTGMLSQLVPQSSKFFVKFNVHILNTYCHPKMALEWSRLICHLALLIKINNNNKLFLYTFYYILYTIFPHLTPCLKGLPSYCLD